MTQKRLPRGLRTLGGLVTVTGLLPPRRGGGRGGGQGRPGGVGDNEPRGGSAGWGNQRRLRLRRERPELELRPVFSVARLRLSSLDEAALSLPAGAASR